MKKLISHISFVIGNEKGGAGKTTCSMHLIAGLLDAGLNVSSIDVDSRQHSLTRYLQNRSAYKESQNEQNIQMPKHFLIESSNLDTVAARDAEEKMRFEEILAKAKENADAIVIDTPGSHTFLSCLAHSYADTVITPINDSFVDLDVMAKVDADGQKIIGPSIYSQMIWDQKMERAKRDGHSIEWLVMRNRLSSFGCKE
jgi:chromosome partitioning protein